MPQRLTKSSIYSRSLHLLALQLVLLSSLETISAIENALGKVRDCQHGLYTAGGVSRVDEMILARERSGFAGKKVWDDIPVGGCRGDDDDGGGGVGDGDSSGGCHGGGDGAAAVGEGEGRRDAWRSVTKGIG
ncbi:hypothetical protein Tco_1041542 [Tanacetum coccineum]|uniref:Uncharacterized protein n=1 Tax=Tanacetum coccineum TaxID=301880 RepID=A0ABQ5GIR4_9ASTR